MRPFSEFVFICTFACGNAATGIAGPVTIDVRTESGVAIEDAVIVFDPQVAAEASPQKIAIIDQIDKRFVPRVSVIRTGTAVTFPNSDRIRHQVYSFSPAKTFTLKLYAGSPSTSVIFDKAGLVVLGCNIHDDMVAFVGVVDSPYFGKSSNTGSVTLSVPEGEYRLRVWHPNLAAEIPTRPISVTAAPMTLAVQATISAAPVTLAPWP